MIKRVIKNPFIVMAVAAGLSLLSRCGAPLGPLPPLWRVVAEFPAEYGPIMRVAAGEDGVYALLNASNVILKYNGGGFTEDYVAGETVKFYDIAFSGDFGFAVGRDETEPILIYYNGAEWEEEIITQNYILSIYKIVTVNKGECLVLLNVRGRGGFVARWDGVSIEVFEGSGPAADNGDFSRDAGILYAWSEHGEVKTSYDGGISWGSDIIRIPHKGYEFKAFGGIGAAAGENLYLYCYFVVGGGDYRGFVKRTGPPGQGNYELSFSSWKGPYFSGIEDIAFRNEQDGIAVGPYTTLHFKGGDWVLETTRGARYKLVTPDPVAGYWGVVELYEGNKQILIYQP